MGYMNGVTQQTLPVGFKTTPEPDLKVQGNAIETERYRIEITGTGSIRVTDKTNGSSFNVWGDPHITTSDGDKMHFEDGPITVMLKDGTKLTLTPTPKDANGVAWLDKVMVMKGDEAVCATDMSTCPVMGKVGQNAALIDGLQKDGSVFYVGEQVDDFFAQKGGQEIVGTNPNGGMFGGEWDLDDFGGVAPQFRGRPICRTGPKVGQDPLEGGVSDIPAGADVMTIISIILRRAQRDLFDKVKDLKKVSDDIGLMKQTVSSLPDPKNGGELNPVVRPVYNVGDELTPPQTKPEAEALLSDLEAKRSELLFEVQQLQQRIKEASDLRSTISKLDHDTAMTVVGNMR